MNKETVTQIPGCHGRGSFKSGFTKINNVEPLCQNRWMVRVMSSSSVIDFYGYQHEAKSVLRKEKHTRKILLTNQK